MKNGRKVCSYCGLETSMDDKGCDSCGSTKFETVKEAAAHKEVFRQNFEQMPQEQQRQYQVRQDAQKREQEKKDKTKKIVSIVGIILVVAIVISYFSSNKALNNNKTGDSMHKVNSVINTDWFKMTVYEGKIIRAKNSYCGLVPPANGYERILIDIKLYNHLSDENLDINIAEDFYLERNSSKYASLNTGGNYTVFDKLSTDGMFFGKFMVSPKKELHGYIAFDVPLPISTLRFVYEEYNYNGDERTDLKKRYKVDLEYETPQIPQGSAQAFYDNAFNAGYILEVINDYDGYDTFWVGAHKYVDESAKGLLKKPEPVYWIDCTRDISAYNAKVEFNNYVKKVTANGGTESSDSGTENGITYQYQYNVNTVTGKFGIAYQIDKYNYLIESAPISEMDEILAFLEFALNLNVKT